MSTGHLVRGFGCSVWVRAAQAQFAAAPQTRNKGRPCFKVFGQNDFKVFFSSTSFSLFLSGKNGPRTSWGCHPGTTTLSLSSVTRLLRLLESQGYEGRGFSLILNGRGNRIERVSNFA